MKFPYKCIEFTKEGRLYDASEREVISQWIAANNLTDLFIISHGWNNDMDEADSLYRDLSGFLGEALGAVTGKKFGVLGAYWPSKRFADADLIAGGGAAGIDSGEQVAVNGLIDILRTEFTDATHQPILQALEKTSRQLMTHDNAPQEFVRKIGELLQLVQLGSAETEDNLASAILDEENPKTLLIRLADAEAIGTPAENGGAAGGITNINTAEDTEDAAARLGFVDDIVAGARNLLNLTTYYTMKERAGTVGKRGMQPLILNIINTFPQLRLHLIGHSFGGRLMATAVSSLPANHAVNTLVLLQAAFSHYGFSDNFDGKGGKGLFRSAVSERKVKGPVIISHTHNDKAVGKAYAVASRLANQTASFFGGPDDKFGGIGANGAQKSGASNAFKMMRNSQYKFQPGMIYNLNADNCIGGHSDIRKIEVAEAIANCIDFS